MSNMNEQKIAQVAQALSLGAEGCKIFPIKQGTKNRPHVHWGRGGVGEKATDNPEIIKNWFTKWPDANIGIATGPSNLLVLDIDMKPGKDGEEALQILEMFYDTPPTTREVRTGSGGRHLIYRTNTPVPSRVNFLSELIGNGIDIRSHGGMIVAAGSKTKAGEYTWINPGTPIADAPEWLIELCLKNPWASTERTMRDREPGAAPQLAPLVELDEDYAVELAAAFLQQHPPAIEGEGGDHHTFHTACCVKDYGVSEEKCLELLLENWNETCEPPWKVGELKVKVRNAYTYGTEPPGVMSPLAHFDVVETEEGDLSVERDTSKTSTEPSNRFLMIDQILNMLRASFLIAGFLTEGALAVLFGPPGSKKTFAALHAALCVATGLPFFNRQVKQGPVIYLAGESPAGFRLRVGAWLRFFNFTGTVPFYLQPGGLPLNQGNEVDKLLRAIRSLNVNPRLIVVDTLGVYLEGNENGPEHMSSFLRACQKLRDKTGATVLIIHHVGKDPGKGPRGHTALQGGADAMFEMTDKKPLVELACRKMKDADDNFFMTLETVSVTVDPEGEMKDSLVLQECAQPLDAETRRILTLASEFDGKGLKGLAGAVSRELKVSLSTARRKIPKAIPEGRTKAISFEGGALWLEPDPSNTKQGGKTVRYEKDFPDLNEEEDETDIFA